MVALPASGSIRFNASGGTEGIKDQFGVDDATDAGIRDFLRGGSNVVATLGTSGIPTAVPISLSDFYGATSVRFSSFTDTPTFVDIASGDDVTYSSTLTLTKANDFTAAIEYDIELAGTVLATNESVGVGSSSDGFSITGAASTLPVGTNMVRAYNSPFQSGELTANIVGHSCTADWNYTGTVQPPPVTPPGVAVTSTCTAPQPSTPNPPTATTPPGVAVTSTCTVPQASTPNPPTATTPPGVAVSSTCTVPQAPTPCSNCAPGTQPCSNCAPGTTPTPPTPGVGHPSFAGGACQTGFTFTDCTNAFPTGCFGCSVANPPTPCSNCAPGTQPCTNCAPGTTPTPAQVFPANQCFSFSLATCQSVCSGCGDCPDTFTPTPPTPNPALVFPANQCFTSFTLSECNTACPSNNCGDCPDTFTPTPPTPNPALVFPADQCFTSFTLPECNTACPSNNCGDCPDTTGGPSSSSSGTFSSRTRVQAQADIDCFN